MWPENRKKSTLYFSHVWLLIHRLTIHLPNREQGLHLFTGCCFWESWSTLPMYLPDTSFSLSETVRDGRPHEQLWRKRMERWQWWWCPAFLSKALQAGWETGRSPGAVPVELRILTYSISLARATWNGQCSLCTAPNEQGRRRLSQKEIVSFWNCTVCVCVSHEVPAYPSGGLFFRVSETRTV